MVVRWSFEDNPPTSVLVEIKGIPTQKGGKFEEIICQDCAAASQEYEQEILTGSVCAMCHEPFATPGGTTIQTYDRKRLLRVCYKCKAAIDLYRGDAW
jgi:hypothetical protein